MLKFLQVEPPRLREDETGTIRVGDSRVTLDVVLGDYLDGATPAEIVDRYDVLTLADVHYAIAYYLSRQTDVDAYLHRREIEADELERKIRESQPPQLTRDELLERLKRKEPRDVTAGG